MRVAASMLLVGVVFGATVAAPAAAHAVLVAPFAVAAGIALACIVDGRWSAVAVGTGAVGGAAFVLLEPVWPAMAGAVLVAAVHAPRAVRVRDAAAAWLLTALSAGTGAVGAWLAASFATGPASLASVAAAMGALLTAAPWLVPVDDARAHALRLEAQETRGTLRWTLLRAVVLRRRWVEARAELSRDQRRRLERGWRTLEDLAVARRDPPCRARRAIDDRIGAHVDAFERLWRAWRTRRALSDGLDLDALEELASGGDELEADVAGLSEAGWKESAQPVDT